MMSGLSFPSKMYRQRRMDVKDTGKIGFG